MSISNSAVRKSEGSHQIVPSDSSSEGTCNQRNQAQRPVVDYAHDTSQHQKIKNEWENYRTHRIYSEPDEASSGELSEELADMAPLLPQAMQHSSTATVATLTGSVLTTLATPALSMTTADADQLEAPGENVAVTAQHSLAESATSEPTLMRRPAPSSVISNNAASTVSTPSPKVLIRPRSVIRLATSTLSECITLLKAHLSNAAAKKLVVQFSDAGDFYSLERLCWRVQQELILPVPGKEIVLQVDQPVRDMRHFSKVLLHVEKAMLFTEVNLVGDAVIATWAPLMSALETQPVLHTLQLSGATSDAVCGCFKVWLKYQQTSTATARSGLPLKAICFADLTISDAAVFGAMLRELVARISNVGVLDFSKTRLSAQQINQLCFQLAAAGRADSLKFTSD